MSIYNYSYPDILPYSSDTPEQWEQKEQNKAEAMLQVIADYKEVLDFLASHSTFAPQGKLPLGALDGDISGIQEKYMLQWSEAQLQFIAVPTALPINGQFVDVASHLPVIIADTTPVAAIDSATFGLPFDSDTAIPQGAIIKLWANWDGVYQNNAGVAGNISLVLQGFNEEFQDWYNLTTSVPLNFDSTAASAAKDKTIGFMFWPFSCTKGATPKQFRVVGMTSNAAIAVMFQSFKLYWEYVPV